MPKIHGRLGAAALAATTDTTVYTVPASRKATVTVSICNRSASAVNARLMHIDGNLAALATEDYLLYDTPIPGNGFLERTGLTISAGHTIAARAASADLSVQVHGVEEDAL